MEMIEEEPMMTETFEEEEMPEESTEMVEEEVMEEENTEMAKEEEVEEESTEMVEAENEETFKEEAQEEKSTSETTTASTVQSKKLAKQKKIQQKKAIVKNLARIMDKVDKDIKDIAKNLAIKIGVDEERIIVINPGVNPAEDLNKKSTDKVENLLKHKSPRLITVSRYDKRKNHEKIIMALRNLKQIYPDIIYICVGHGDEEENIKKLVTELDLDEQVMFFKNISNELKNSLVAQSNIFVMPSIVYKKSVEGFGIAFVEAAQYGIPSIGGSDGGAADAIDHKKTGLICDGNNLDEIYSSINLMLENKKYLEYGKNAKDSVSKFYWSNIIKKYKEILN